jgi:hypothetical protein
MRNALRTLQGRELQAIYWYFHGLSHERGGSAPASEATHTDRFKTIVSHAGVFDLTSLYAMDVNGFLEFEQNSLMRIPARSTGAKPAGLHHFSVAR